VFAPIGAENTTESITGALVQQRPAARPRTPKPHEAPHEARHTMDETDARQALQESMDRRDQGESR
jgi:hypothetical protein